MVGNRTQFPHILLYKFTHSYSRQPLISPILKPETAILKPGTQLST